MKQILSSPKTDMFRLRINPEVRRDLEAVYARNGLTLTDAINVFFQQESQFLADNRVILDNHNGLHYTPPARVLSYLSIQADDNLL